MRILIAGVGNIFLSDDGFGVEVARRLAGRDLPEGVRVADFGIRGIHLAYEILNGWDLTVLVDAVPRGGTPGTLYRIAPDLSNLPAAPPSDAHGMHPEAVLAIVKAMGGTDGRIEILGCEPACTDEGMALSPPVEQAVDEAISMLTDLVKGAV